VRGRTERTLSASRSRQCSLTFENNFQGRRSSTQPAERDAPLRRCGSAGQANVEGNFLRTSDESPLGAVQKTGTAGREARNAEPSGSERKRWIPTHPTRKRVFGLDDDGMVAPTLRRRSTAAAGLLRELRADTGRLFGAGRTNIAPAMIGPLPPHFGAGGRTLSAQSLRWRGRVGGGAARRLSGQTVDAAASATSPNEPSRAASAATRGE
jgi:hypothetical protein